MSGEEGEFFQICTCTKGMVVYAAGISVKVGAYIRGGLSVCHSFSCHLLVTGGAGRSQQRE
jgi:hypothetical protein